MLRVAAVTTKFRGLYWEGASIELHNFAFMLNIVMDIISTGQRLKVMLCEVLVLFQVYEYREAAKGTPCFLSTAGAQASSAHPPALPLSPTACVTAKMLKSSLSVIGGKTIEGGWCRAFLSQADRMTKGPTATITLKNGALHWFSTGRKSWYFFGRR